MTTPKGTRRQHFVPQLLLNSFADMSAKLFGYDMAADKVFRTTVRDAGHQSHFLSDPARDGDEGPGSYFEHFFQQFEGTAASAVRNVEAHAQLGVLQVIGPAEREPLAQFIALQYLRTPAARAGAVQVAEMLKHSLATELLRKNAFDVENRSIQQTLEDFAVMTPDEQREMQAANLLDPAVIDDMANKLSAHVWLMAVNRTQQPLYIADHPVALHGHVHRPGRGVGIASYGVEVTLPLSSTLQLSLYEREFVRDELLPEIESLDGCLYLSLDPDNILYARWLQVTSARQFVYCPANDFADARRICDANPELRDPDRPRVGGFAFGRPVRPLVGTRRRPGRG
jgi:hypothetical protein